MYGWCKGTATCCDSNETKYVRLGGFCVSAEKRNLGLSLSFHHRKVEPWRPQAAALLADLGRGQARPLGGLTLLVLRGAPEDSGRE